MPKRQSNNIVPLRDDYQTLGEKFFVGAIAVLLFPVTLVAVFVRYLLVVIAVFFLPILMVLGFISDFFFDAGDSYLRALYLGMTLLIVRTAFMVVDLYRRMWTGEEPVFYLLFHKAENMEIFRSS